MKKALVIFTLSSLVVGLSAGGYRWYKNRYHYKPYQVAQIFIQAGHEGRTRGATGAESKYGREIDWTPIVADEATRVLREAGISVIRADADHYSVSRVHLAISIHFDAAAKACRTGASIGYDDPTDKPAADIWRNIYSEQFPFKWMRDNFTRNLKSYYNYRYTITKDSELLLELGDINCKEQAQWLKPRLKKLGQLIAYFAAQRLGNSSVPKPSL